MSFEDATRDYELQEEPQCSDDDLARWEFIQKTYGDYFDEESAELGDYFVSFYNRGKMILKLYVEDLSTKDFKDLEEVIDETKKENASTEVELDLNGIYITVYCDYVEVDY